MNRPGPDERFIAVDDSTLAETQRWLEHQGPGLFPPGCALSVQRYDQSVTSLPEVTEAALKNAVEKRRREFSAGRVAASAALGKLGASNSSFIPIGTNRNPLWPAGFIGSITHTAGLAIAVVARTRTLAAVGVDLELSSAVQPELWPSILRTSEIDFVSRKPIAEQSRWATIFFSAKESFYKMQSPLTGEWVDFHDAEISISEKTREFELVCNQSAAAQKLQRAHFTGRYLTGSEFSLTALWLSTGERELPAT